jgi:hypothetical protein
MILVCLSYNYDAEQLGFNIVSEHKVNSEHRNNSRGLGRNAVLPSSVNSSISYKQLSTFKAAYITLLICQLLGVYINARYGDFVSEDIGFDPTLDGHHFISLWPILSYPIVVIAMVLSVFIKSQDHSIDRLWVLKQEWNSKTDRALVMAQPVHVVVERPPPPPPTVIENRRIFCDVSSLFQALF